MVHVIGRLGFVGIGVRRMMRCARAREVDPELT